MQYFQAVQQGKQRAAKSQMKIFEAAGFGAGQTVGGLWILGGRCP